MIGRHKNYTIYTSQFNNLNDLPWTSMDHVQGNNDSLQFKLKNSDRQISTDIYVYLQNGQAIPRQTCTNKKARQIWKNRVFGWLFGKLGYGWDKGVMIVNPELKDLTRLSW